MTGKELKNILSNFGLKNTEIAKKLNKTPQTIQGWFNYQNVNTSILEEICDVYNMKINDFYIGTKYAVIEQNTNEKAELSPEFLYVMKQRDEFRDEVKELKKQLGIKEKTAV